jgi:hypothetical protein
MYKKIEIPEQFSFKWLDDVQSLIFDGEISATDFKECFEYLKSQKDFIETMLNTKTKDELFKFITGYVRDGKKQELVKKVYDQMVSVFLLGGVSYSPFTETYQDAVNRKVANTTQEDLAKYAEKIKLAREGIQREKEAFKKALDNPETLEEFKVFIKYKGLSALSISQKEKYDSMVSEGVIQKRTEDLAKKSEITQVNIDGAEMSLTETIHTRDKYPLFVVQLTNKVDKPIYDELLKKAKQLGGWYSSFRGGGAIAGFQFKEKSNAEKFMQLKDGSVSNLDVIEAKQEVKLEKRADKLRQNAESLITSADNELNKERLTNTYRRANMANAAENNALEKKRIAQTMLNIANAIDSGEVKYLDNITAKTHIELLDSIISNAKFREARAKFPNESSKQEEERRSQATLETIEYVSMGLYPKIYKSHLQDLVNKASVRSGGKLIANRWDKKLKGAGEDYQVRDENEMLDIKKMFDSISITDQKYNRIKEYLLDFSRMKSMKIENDSMLREILREYIQYRGGKKEIDKVKQLERDLAGKGSSVGFDYFPTPKSVSSKMAEMAEIQPNMTVLEPSAGNGNIADAIKDAGVMPDVIEISSTLSDILKAKGYNLVGSDFDTFNTKTYDRIIMNPPFSNGADADHIRHAYTLLNSGGRIVAIAGEGIFIRNDKKAQDFRNWIYEVNAEVEKLPEGTFQDKTLYSTTGANARLIVIDKPKVEIEELVNEEVKQETTENNSTKDETLQAIELLRELSEVQSGSDKEETLEAINLLMDLVNM